MSLPEPLTEILAPTAEEEARKIRTITTLLHGLNRQVHEPSVGSEDDHLTAASHIATLLSQRIDATGTNQAPTPQDSLFQPS